MSGWRSEVGAVAAWVLVVGAALGAGAVAGVGLAATGVLDLTDDPVTIAAYDQASYYSCPDGGRLGFFTRGDRVYLTGRDAAGSWIQVRAPLDTGARVWIRGSHVTPDAVFDLPVEVCEEPVVPTTTVPTTDTTGVTDTTAPTDTTATTGTTAAPDTTATLPAPSVGLITASKNPIWEEYPANPNSCNGLPATATRSTIAAVINAPSGVQSVVMLWSVGTGSGSSAMAAGGGGVYSAVLGPFDAQTLNLVPQNQSLTITVTVQVTDAIGRTATGQKTVTLNDCTFG